MFLTQNHQFNRTHYVDWVDQSATMSKVLDMLLRGQKDVKKKALMGNQSTAYLELPSPKYKIEDVTVEMPPFVDQKDRWLRFW